LEEIININFLLSIETSIESLKFHRDLVIFKHKGNTMNKNKKTVHVAKIFVSPDGETRILGAFTSRSKAVGKVRSTLRHHYPKNASVYVANNGSVVEDGLRTTSFVIVGEDHHQDGWHPTHSEVEEVALLD
jgi:hypothetical protein